MPIQLEADKAAPVCDGIEKVKILWIELAGVSVSQENQVYIR